MASRGLFDLPKKEPWALSLNGKSFYSSPILSFQSLPKWEECTKPFPLLSSLPLPFLPRFNKETFRWQCITTENIDSTLSIFCYQYEVIFMLLPKKMVKSLFLTGSSKCSCWLSVTWIYMRLNFFSKSLTACNINRMPSATNWLLFF
jgi:hypothetical protein